MLEFICYPKCTTCQRAQAWLDEKGIEYTVRNIKENKPAYDEITAWYKMSKLDIKRFFNTSGLMYRSMGLKDKLDKMTIEEKIELLATDGMLVKRPVLLGDGFVLLGFREKEWEETV